jgi:hypothetical protein
VPALVADTLGYPVGLGVIGGLRVLVPKSHFDAARGIVQAVERGDYALREPSDGLSK